MADKGNIPQHQYHNVQSTSNPRDTTMARSTVRMGLPGRHDRTTPHDNSFFFFFRWRSLRQFVIYCPPRLQLRNTHQGNCIEENTRCKLFFIYFRYFFFYTEDYCISSIGAHNLQQDEQAEKSAPCRWRSPNLLLGEKMRRLIGPGLSRPITCQPHFIPQLRQTSLFRTSPPLIGICLTNTEAYGNCTTRVVHNWLEGHNHENTHRLSRIARSV